MLRSSRTNQMKRPNLIVSGKTRIFCLSYDGHWSHTRARIQYAYIPSDGFCCCFELCARGFLSSASVWSFYGLDFSDVDRRVETFMNVSISLSRLSLSLSPSLSLTLPQSVSSILSSIFFAVVVVVGWLYVHIMCEVFYISSCFHLLPPPLASVAASHRLPHFVSFFLAPLIPPSSTTAFILRLALLFDQYYTIILEA